MKKLLAIALTICFAQSSFAGKCDIVIKRDPCPGKETEAFKPYNGKSETTESKDVASDKDCSAFAEKSAKIVRKGALAKKTVTGTFDGKALGPFTGESACK